MSGRLDVGDGHRIWWECCGDPEGKPALYLHGGPGSGCTPGSRRYFDPRAYRAVLFDQRGCGRSLPRADAPDADLASNTTAHLVRDIELLRAHLGIERWVVLGLSWGTTLALAYAQAHPARVDGMILASVTTTSRREVDWITRGVRRIFPREWERFIDAVPEKLRGLAPADAYANLLFDADPEVRANAARSWCAWEEAHMSLGTGNPSAAPRFADPAFRLCFARLVTHYWRHTAFLEDDQLVRDASQLNGIPGALIHGRLDISSPLETAWRLSRAWAGSHLQIVDDAGHGGAAIVGAVVGALRSLG